MSKTHNTNECQQPRESSFRRFVNRSSSSSSSSIHILKVRHESRVESTNDHRKHSHCCSSLPTGTRTQTWHCTKVRNGINYTGRNKTTQRMQQTTPKHTTKLKHRTHIQNGCDHGDVNVQSAATISCPAIIIVILTSRCRKSKQTKTGVVKFVTQRH